MSVSHIEQAIQQGLWRLDQRFAVTANQDFISTLTIGQIIKGKVLRHYDGGRYGVMFGGEERVVDSAIPLRSGEILHGRVVALDDKVHLQRVAVTGEDGARRPAGLDSEGIFAQERQTDAIRELFQRHRATLTAGEQSRIRALGRSIGSLSVVASGALVLRKLGLVLDETLIRAVARGLQDRGTIARPVAGREATTLTAEASETVANNHETMRVLSDALARFTVPDLTTTDERSVERPALEGGSGDDAAGADAGDQRDRGSQERREWLLGRWLLNAQSEGSVAHRFISVPLWLGGRLVELNLAFFSQLKGESDAEGISYRRVLLSLDLDTLGHVDIEIVAANRRLRVTFEAENELTTQLLSSRLGDLKTDFSEFGWTLDELSYATRRGSDIDLPSQAVISHYVRQDSLSRLM